MCARARCVAVVVAIQVAAAAGKGHTVHAEPHVSCSDRKINSVREGKERKASMFEVRELQSELRDR